MMQTDNIYHMNDEVKKLVMRFCCEVDCKYMHGTH